MDTEVLVLGAGPAGAVAALTLAQRGRKVLLVQRHSGQRRTFGEVLPPGAMVQLVSLGDAKAFDSQRHLRAWVQRTAWGRESLSSRNLSFHPYGCAWHLDREAFDDSLLKAAQRAGVAYASGVRLRRALPLLGSPGWVVDLENFGELNATFVVDASGRASAFARQRGITRVRLDRLVALAAIMGRTEEEEVELIVEARPGGWWYTAPLPGSHAVAALLTDADLIPSGRSAQQAFWARELCETVHVGSRLRGDVPATLSVTPAGMERLASISGNGWVAVGDSVVAFDPLSSMGLAHALETGRLGGIAVDAALTGEQRPLAAYTSLVQRRAAECDILRRAFYAMERRWVDAPFWARRIG